MPVVAAYRTVSPYNRTFARTQSAVVTRVAEHIQSLALIGTQSLGHSRQVRHLYRIIDLGKPWVAVIDRAIGLAG